MHVTLKRIKNHYLECRNGNISLIAALSMMVLIVGAGSAYDLNNLSLHKSNLQASVDSAALSVAASSLESVPELKNIGNSVYDSNAQNPCTTSHPNYTFTNDEVEVVASCSIKQVFMGIIGKEYMPVRAAATAVKKVDATGQAMCVIALEPLDKRTFLASGNSNLSAIGCGVQVNSSNSRAVTLSGNSTLTSDENCIVGGVKQGQKNMTPQPTDSCAPINDPFWTHPKPVVAGCDYNDFNEDTDMTLNPGVYCGGLRASNANFTFNPGLYIIKDGIFESTGGATLNGDGVTFFLTGIDAGIVWGGGGNYNFKAMSSGTLASFIVFLDPDAIKEDKSEVTGGGDTYYEGIFYFPKQTLLISGGGSATTVSDFTAYIADYIHYTGGSSLDIKVDPSNTSLPIPRGLYKSAPMTARLIH